MVEKREEVQVRGCRGEKGREWMEGMGKEEERDRQETYREGTVLRGVEWIECVNGEGAEKKGQR